MNKRLKTIPKFANEAAERRFWEKNDSTAYVDWKKAERTAFPQSAIESVATSLWQFSPRGRSIVRGHSPQPLSVRVLSNTPKNTRGVCHTEVSHPPRLKLDIRNRYAVFESNPTVTYAVPPCFDVFY